MRKTMPGGRATVLRCLLGAKRFFRDQSGASYSISVVLILPIYVASIALAVEVVLMLNAHLALSAGLESATHSARVWLPHRIALQDDGAHLNDEIERSVELAMVPFAPTAETRNEVSSNQVSKFQAAGLSLVAQQRFARKLAYLEKGVGVSTQWSAADTQRLDIEIKYAAPIWFPIFEPLLANASLDGEAVRWISRSTEVALPTEEADRQSLGIPFHPRKSLEWK